MKHSMKTKRMIWLILPVGLFVASVTANIVLTARASTVGADVWAMEQKREKLEKYNAELELQISQIASLSTLKAKALELGFVPRQSVVRVELSDTSIAMSGTP